MVTHDGTQRLQNSYSIPQQCALQLRTAEYGHCLLLVQQTVSYSRSLNWWRHWSSHTHQHMPTAWLCRIADVLLQRYENILPLVKDFKLIPSMHQFSDSRPNCTFDLFMFYAMHIIASIHMQMQALGINITSMSLATYIICRSCV